MSQQVSSLERQFKSLLIERSRSMAYEEGQVFTNTANRSSSSRHRC